MPSSRAPGTAMMVWWTGKRISWVSRSVPSPNASSSRSYVVVTDPISEFSIGRQPASASPVRTAATTSLASRQGSVTRSGQRRRAAASLKEP